MNFKMLKNHPYPHFQSKKVMVKQGTYKNMKWNICKRARLTFRNVIKMYSFRNAFDVSSKAVAGDKRPTKSKLSFHQHLLAFMKKIRRNTQAEKGTYRSISASRGYRGEYAINIK